MVTWANKNPNENVQECSSAGSKNLPLDGLSLGGKSHRSLPLRDITVSMRLADGERVMVVGQQIDKVGYDDGDEETATVATAEACGILSPFDEEQDTDDGAHFPSVRKKFWGSTTAWQSHSAPPSPSPSPRQQSGFRDNSRRPFLLTPHPPQPISKVRPPPPLQQPPRRSIDGNHGEFYEGGQCLPCTPGGRRDMKGLIGPGMKLDLGALQRNRDACEPTEMQLKRDKFAFFDKECSRVAEHIYLGSDSVARNRETLRESGITHVLNCVGFVCPEYFRDDLSYKTLWLQDSPSEDITSILYDVFDYFEEVREQSGRVFVHCCQGVSRSTSLVIAYLMWRDGRSFEDAFQDVKAARGVTNPNMGFACQLLQCQKRVHATPVSPNSALRMYRMAPHSPYDPLHLVPKTVNHPAASALDSRGAFVVHVPGALYVWQGSKCDSGMAAAAHAFTCQVVRYERADDNNIQVREGEEPSEFWEALRSEMPLVGKNVGHQDPGAGKDSGSPETGRNAESGTVFLRVKQLAVYDTDYSLYHRAKGQAVIPVEPIPGVVIHGTPRDSGWSRLRRKFFCIPGSKPMLMREGVNGAGLSQPVSTTGSKNEVPGVGGAAASPNLSQCSSASSFSFRSFSSNSSQSPPFLASPCISPPSSPVLSRSHSTFPNSALALSPILGESLSTHMPFPSLDHFPSQLESKPFSHSSSKGPTLSLAQRRGGVSPSLCLPSLVHGASMTPRRNPELSPISTGNLTECNMLATVEICNTYCELDAHNKVREKFPDAINNTAPQDGDEQVVPITRRPDSFVQEDVKVETTVIIKSVRLEAEAPELYEWPQMEKIHMFMEDDLESHAAYVLVVPDAPSGRGGHVYVWVGQSWRSDGDGESPEEDDNGHRTSEEHWVIIGQDLIKQWELRLDIPVKVN
jgi:hypothetical protein